MKTIPTLVALVAILNWTHPCFPVQVHAQQDKFSIKPDVVYGHKDGMALTYDVITPTKTPKALALFLWLVVAGCQPGCHHSKWPAHCSHPLLNEGYTILPVRHGSSPKYVVPEIVADVKLALKHISENAEDHQIKKDKLGVFGFSAGGHLSLILGTQTNDVGTPLKPTCSSRSRCFPTHRSGPYVANDNPIREQFPALKFDPKKADQVSPLKHVSQDDAPTFLIHGDKDELVPIWHSEKIEQEFKAKNVPTEFVIIRGRHMVRCRGKQTNV